jgi:hypothetical protein
MSQPSWGSSFQRFLLGLSAISLALTLDSFFALVPALAADSVVFKTGPFERSLPVEDLRTYAETQEASSRLKSLLRYLNSEDQVALREFLQISYPLNVVTVDNLIRTDYGQQFLSEAAEVTVRRDDSGVKALQAALILGTVSSEGLGVISFLEAYPSQELTVDLPRALKFIKANKQILERLRGLQQPTS